jgi:hypothetical protein
MYICYGISNGPYSPGRYIWEEDDRYLWRAALGCGIAVQEKDDLVLTVPDFDPTKSTAVKITLKRKAGDTLLIELTANSSQLCGKPELVWSEWRD